MNYFHSNETLIEENESFNEFFQFKTTIEEFSPLFHFKWYTMWCKVTINVFSVYFKCSLLVEVCWLCQVCSCTVDCPLYTDTMLGVLSVCLSVGVTSAHKLSLAFTAVSGVCQCHKRSLKVWLLLWACQCLLIAGRCLIWLLTGHSGLWLTRIKSQKDFSRITYT